MQFNTIIFLSTQKLSPANFLKNDITFFSPKTNVSQLQDLKTNISQLFCIISVCSLSEMFAICGMYGYLVNGRDVPIDVSYYFHNSFIEHQNCLLMVRSINIRNIVRWNVSLFRNITFLTK